MASGSTSPKLDKLARSDSYFVERNLFANVDYYSAIVLYTLGIDIDSFTPLFAMSRIAGWSAHIIEQMQHNKLIRPTSTTPARWGCRGRRSTSAVLAL